jgi:mRNA-degrading endonuclease RelE of RelBE toxin-antitoxin system
MWHEIILAPEAVEDLRGLSAFEKARVTDAIETHLRHEPARASKSRIKRLRGESRPQYRLRGGEIRVFYDINQAEAAVEILAIVSKDRAEEWLRERGQSHEAGSSGESEG